MSDIVPLFLQGRQTMSVGVDASDDAGRKIIGFPNPVNEKAARTVAGGVLLLCSVTLVLSLSVSDRWLWLTVPIALGFVARVLTGPRLSPLGQVATRLVAPRLGIPKLVPGPPKRFAQGIGSVVTTAAVGVLALGFPMATQALLASHDRGRGPGVDLRVLCRLPDLRRFDATRCDPSGDLRSMQQRLACAASASTNLDSLIRRSGCRPARRPAC